MTALQQLLWNLRQMSVSGWFSLDEIEGEILALIPEEKKQLCDFWVQGNKEGWAAQTDWPQDAEKYYNDTYGNESAATPAT